MNNTQKKIEELEVKIAELEAELNKPKAMFERAERQFDYTYVDDVFSVRSFTERGTSVDDKAYESTNYYLGTKLAEKVAKYYRDNNWFIRKAIEFADGYEWVTGGENHFVIINQQNKYMVEDANCRNITDVFMSCENAQKFKAWLEEFAPLESKS